MNNLITDFARKMTNLCEFLSGERGERFISSRLFDKSVTLSERAAALSLPTLSKAELSSLKKEAALLASDISLLLAVLAASGHISAAQEQSAAQTLHALKKEINI